MTTRSVDPAGQHQLPIQTSLPGAHKNTAYWNDRFPLFDVPFDQLLLPNSDDPKPLRHGVRWLVAAGSDLLLQCETLLRGAAVTDDVVVRAYDSSGNPLNVLGQFRRPEDALAVLPALLTVAHMLYPSFLLMARGAQDHEVGQEGRSGANGVAGHVPGSKRLYICPACRTSKKAKTTPTCPSCGASMLPAPDKVVEGTDA